MAESGNIDLGRGYTPLAPQQAFHESQAYGRLLSGGVGGGKTKAGCRECLRVALSHPGSYGVVMRRRASDLQKSTWRTFRREMDETGLSGSGLVHVTGGQTPQSPPHVRFAPELGGGEIVFVHGENEEPLYGMEPDWVFVDEGGEIADQIFITIINRLRGTPRADGKVRTRTKGRVAGPLRFWVASNPGPSGWLRRNFRPYGIPGEPKRGYEAFNVPIFENVYLPEGYVERIREENTGLNWERFGLGSWAYFTGQVFTQFDWDRHVTDDVHDLGLGDGRYLVVEGYDFGREVETAVVWIRIDEQGEEPILVFHDYGEEMREVADHAQSVKDVRSLYGIRNVWCLGDPTGVGQGKTWGSEAFAREDIHIAACKSGLRPQARDTLLGRMLGKTMDDGRPLIQFCRRTTGEGRLVDQLTRAHYVDYKESPDHGPRDQRAKKDDHRLDALEYALYAALPYYGLEAPLPKRRAISDYSDISVPMPDFA